MNKEQKSLVKSIIITLTIILVSGLVFLFISKNGFFGNLNEDVKVNYKVASSSTVMDISGKSIFVSSNIIDVTNEDSYHFKLVLETVDNYHGVFSYEIKLNDTVIVPEEKINGYKKDDVIIMYEGTLPEKGSRFTITLKNYDYKESLNTENNIKFIY